MVIRVLSENTSISHDFGCEHGLSLYIDTGDHRILFDIGASDLFIENARKLQVDLEAVDLAVISHGHADHGGGLGAFLNINSHARVYLQHQAFEKHYALRTNGDCEYIGLDESLRHNRRLIFTADRFVIGKGIQVFSTAEHLFPLPAGNANLLAERDGQLVPDSFFHEQNLVVQSAGKAFLFTGCAHHGIENILERYRALFGCLPDYAIGGLHLRGSAPASGTAERVEALAKILAGTQVKFLTGHCTGIEPFNHLKRLMGEQIAYISAGTDLVL